MHCVIFVNYSFNHFKNASSLASKAVGPHLNFPLSSTPLLCIHSKYRHYLHFSAMFTSDSICCCICFRNLHMQFCSVFWTVKFQMSEIGIGYVVVILTAVLKKKVNSKRWIAKQKVSNDAFLGSVSTDFCITNVAECENNEAFVVHAN